MTNGTLLSKKNDNFKLEFNKVRKAIALSGERVYHLSCKVKGVKPKLKLTKPMNPINDSGDQAEFAVSQSITSILNELNFTFFDKYTMGKKGMLRVYPPCELKSAFGQQYIISDMLAINNRNGNQLYIEIKNQQKNGSVKKNINETARQYAMLQKPVLFVVLGDYFSENNIYDKNDTWKNRNESDYVMMISYHDLKSFFEIWTNNVCTNFEHIRIIMESKKERLKERLAA